MPSKTASRNRKQNKYRNTRRQRQTIPPYLAYVHPHIYQKKGKYGIGTYARKAIPADTIIIQELPQNIPDTNDDDYRFKLIKHLLEDDITRREFLQMVPTKLDDTMDIGRDLSAGHAKYLPDLTDDEMKLYFLKIRRNAFSFENHPSLLFYSTRMNHSCNANVRYYKDTVSGDSNKECMTFKTRRPIEANEEIFDSYIDSTLPKSERQNALKIRYGFDCACDKCVE